MGQPAIQNEKRFLTARARGRRGFTLIEVMVALMVLALGMLASVIGIMTALDYSMKNEMRNDAVKIAQEQEEAVRNMPYAQISTIAQAFNVTRQVRNADIVYTVTPVVTPVPTGQNCGGSCGASIVQFTVTWSFKGAQCTPYVLQTIVRQQ